MLRLTPHIQPLSLAAIGGGSSKSSILVLLPLVFTASMLVAAPVQRDDAYLAANTELPRFFAGPWQLAGELTLHNLSGDTVAYTFMFARPKAQAAGILQTPAAFLTQTRERLSVSGKTVTGDATELYGEDVFASIVISADNTEPPILRCFKGLPPHVVKEADALAMAAKSSGTDAWRVRHCLMLGLFDESFSLETATDTASALVVDMRTRTIMPHADALARAKAKQARVPDAQLVLKCQEAWNTYRVAGKSADKQLQPKPAPGRPPMRVAVPELTEQPLLPNPK